MFVLAAAQAWTEINNKMYPQKCAESNVAVAIYVAMPTSARLHKLQMIQLWRPVLRFHTPFTLEYAVHVYSHMDYNLTYVLRLE